MPSVQPGSIIKEVRRRKELHQVFLQESNNHAFQTISRIENNHHAPREDVLGAFLTILHMPQDDYFCPYLDGAPSDVYQMRSQLLLCLDEAEDENALEEAKRILERLEKTAVFEKVRNRHFLLSCKARYNEMVEGDPAVTYEEIKKGMAITFPEFNINKFAGQVLIFEEVELLHTHALTLKRTHALHKAILLLTQIKQGLEKCSEDDIEKEKKLAKVLLTLSGCLIMAEDYAQALAICNEGNEASLKYSRGRYTPAFLHDKAVCLCRLGQVSEGYALFKLAYFGFMLFHKKERADRLRNEAKAMTGREINTYGADKLHFKPIDYHRDYDLTPQAYGSLGEMICAWRKQAGLTLDALSYGICGKPYLYKIEKGVIKQPGVYILEALAERLGRDHNHYFTTFVSQKTFEEKQIRNEILSLLAMRRYGQAEALLNVLEKSKVYQDDINLQFILNARISVMAKGVIRDRECYELIMKAINLTIRNFDESNVHSYYLTHVENILISKLASYYGNNKDMPRALRLTEQLAENVKNRVIDESEKLRSYGALLLNYSKTLGGLGRYQEELFFAEQGISFAVKHKHLINLAGLYISKGNAVYNSGENKEESIPYFAMAHYGAVIVNNERNRKNIAEAVKTKMGLRFD